MSDATREALQQAEAALLAVIQHGECQVPSKPEAHFVARLSYDQHMLILFAWHAVAEALKTEHAP